jgi:predicted nucleic acid-binding protein
MHLNAPNNNPIRVLVMGNMMLTIAATLLKLEHPQRLEADLDSFLESATCKTEN